MSDVWCGLKRALLENKSLKSKTDSLKSIVNRESEKSIGEELNERKQMQNRRRRQMAEEKKERDKKQTIDKLLKKKQEMAHKTKKKKKVDEPKITYRNNQNGIFICLPHDVPLEQIMPSVAKSGDKVSRGSCDRLKCSRNGCENEKKYLCSKTKEPICSLMCYKAINQITWELLDSSLPHFRWDLWHNSRRDRQSIWLIVESNIECNRNT